MELIRYFAAAQVSDAIESWGWLGVADKEPLFVSAFGDVFLRSPDGACWFLDTVEGTLTRRWDDMAAMEVELATPEGREHYLMEVYVQAAAQLRGLIPTGDQVLSFRIPPILSGAMDDPANFELIDFSVGLHLLGQTHRMAHGLPDGTRITGFTIS